jgi:hypothetical protein
MQIGVLLGLWGLLLTYFLVGSGRRSSGSADQAVAEQDPAAAPSPGAELETQRDTAQRQEYEWQLEAMVRRELERVVRAELGRLHDEVAALRKDMVEQVGGQLRLERIQTTRLIGSDIEALQHEVRRLAGASDLVGGMADSALLEHVVDAPPPAVEAAPPRADRGPVLETSQFSEPHLVVSRAAQAQVPPSGVGAQPPGPVPFTPPTVPTPTGTGQPASLPEPLVPPAVVPPPAPAPGVPAPPAELVPPKPAPTPQSPSIPPQTLPPEQDPFAGLPRLTRFVEEDLLLPVEPLPTFATSAAELAPVPDPAPGRRHASTQDAPRVGVSSAPGRRRRRDDETNDILARILADARQH